MIMKHMSKLLAATTLLVAVALSTGCDQTLGDYIVIPGFSGFELSRVRLINASPDIGEVDVWNRAFPYFPNLANGGVTPYTTINDGVRTLRVVPTDATDDSDPIVEMDLKFPIDTYHSVLIVGTADQYQLLRFDDDRTPPVEDTIRFRMIHAIQNGPALRVFGPGNEALAAEIAFTQATGSVEYDDALSDLTIRRTDSDAVVWTGNDAAAGIVDNKSYTIVVYADGNDDFQVLVLENNLAAD